VSPRFKQYTKEEVEESKRKLKETEFEKNDLAAMIIAALIAFVPMMLLVLGIMLGIIWFIFLR
jgi:uncharacterized RDD family membrane protein YckC